MSATANTSGLTPEQREHFLEHGWVKIPGGIPPDNVHKFVNNVWIRLGYDPNDKSTWVDENVHMPRHREIPTKEFAPKAYQAMCEILGGEDRLDPTLFSKSGDSIIANFGTEYWTTNRIHPRDFPNWHIDGDWFTHYLDSGEQGLVVIQLFTDIVPEAGGTYLCEDGLHYMVKWLYEHPQGTNMRDGPNGESAYTAIQSECKIFSEMTGKAGDVILIHPYMPHSASKNHLRNPRFITNPPVTLKEPLNLHRPDPKDNSFTEQVILNSLKNQNLPIDGWKITTERKRFFPFTQGRKIVRIQEELLRMMDAAKKSGEEVDSIYYRGEKLQQWKLGEPSQELFDALRQINVPPVSQTVAGHA